MAGRHCCACDHPGRAEIDRQLATSASSFRVIARQFWLDHDAIRRHRQHVPVRLVLHTEVRKAAQDLDLFELVLENLELASSAVTRAFGANQLQAGRRAEPPLSLALGVVAD